MRSALIIMIILVFSVSVGGSMAAAQDITGGTAADEEAIEGVVVRYAETWNAHDMTAWGALFTGDVDYVNRGGGWWRSNAENIEGHRAIHERLARQDLKMDFELAVADIAFLSPTIALVHVRSSWPGFSGPGRARSEPAGIMTMVMMREEGGAWRIRALQNTLVDDSPQTEQDGDTHR